MRPQPRHVIRPAHRQVRRCQPVRCVLTMCGTGPAARLGINQAGRAACARAIASHPPVTAGASPRRRGIMSRTARLAAIGGVTIAAAVIAPGTSQAATQTAGHAYGGTGAVFVQTDAVTGNAVAVYDRAAGGTLQAA